VDFRKDCTKNSIIDFQNRKKTAELCIAQVEGFRFSIDVMITNCTEGSDSIK
jgi:hypothetical protein